MRKLLFFLLLVSNVAAFAQVNAGADQTICLGDTTTLNGTGPANYTYTWTSVPPDNTMSNPNILNPTVHPLQTTTYTLEGRSVSFTNLVTNGDFETGNNTGFTSAYQYMPGPSGSIYNAGTYAITQDAGNNHPNFSCDQDHTSGSGYFMAINGAQTANVEVWSTTISNISQNTEYEFSTWVASLSPTSPAILQFRINGVLLGDPFNASNITCQWNKFFEKWNSGTATSADISIINQNTAGNGNDFSLDDINFSKVTYHYDDSKVNVAPIPTSSFDMASQSCSSDTTTVSYTGSASPSAQYNWDFGSATVLSGTGAGDYQLQWSTPGFHSVTLMVEEICASEPTTHTINIKQSPVSTLTADATIIPYGTSTILHGVMDGNPGPFSFEWFPPNLLQNPTVTDPETVLLEQSTLFVFTTTDETSLCKTPDSILISITGGPLNITSLTATPSSICLGTSTDLSVSIEGGSGNYSCTWQSDPAGFYHSGSETTVTVFPTENTSYFVEVTDGFTTTPPISIDVVVLPQIEIVTQARDTLIEAGQLALFTVEAINLTSYQWQLSSDNGQIWTNLDDDLTYSGSHTYQLTVSNAGVAMHEYQYRCLIEGDCDPVIGEAVVLSVIDSPLFIGSLQDVAACQLDTITIPCHIENFTHITHLALSFTYETGLLQFYQLSDIHPDLSTLSISQQGDSIQLLWSASAGLNINDGALFELSFIAVAGGQTSIQWQSSCFVENQYGFYPPLSFSAATILITSLPQPPDLVTSSIDSLNILDEVDIELMATGGFGTELIWTTDSCNGQFMANGSPLTIFRPEQTTTYFAKWTNLCGESTCERAEVEISEQFSFAVPTAFSPNNDGLNDVFGIISPSTLPVFLLQIYNRWGQLVFSTNTQHEQWDGTLNGKKVPQGTYIWKANYQYRLDGNGSESHQETGMVTLVY